MCDKRFFFRRIELNEKPIVIEVVSERKLAEKKNDLFRFLKN